MTARFEFRSSPAVVFGAGSIGRLGELARPLGRRAFLVTGGGSLAAAGRLAAIVDALADAGIASEPFAVRGEPDVGVVDEGARRAKEAGCDLVVAIGGGSVLDAGKAIAALVPGGGSALDYLQDLPDGAGGRAVSTDPLPFVAAPTTTGSGSEVTKNAVLRVPSLGLKRSMRSDRMVPAVALVDPDLARGAPREVIVPAALDALTHLIEGYVSRGAAPMTDLLALAGLGRSVPALRALASGALGDVTDPLALASLWGGMVLANAGLGAVHGLVAPLGGRFDIPHGCGCGAMLAATLRVNVAALRQREPTSPALARYDAVAALVAGPGASAEEAAVSLDALRRDLGARPLAAYGVTHAGFDDVVRGARGGNMKTNPIVLTDAELVTILEASLGPSDAA